MSRRTGMSPDVTARIEAEAKRIAANFPAPTDEQIDIIAALLRGTTSHGAGGRDVA